jgi:hypothetical protein
MRVEVISNAPSLGGEKQRLRDCRERGLHFVAGVKIAGFFGDGDAGGKDAARFGDVSRAHEKLTKLVVAGYVVGIVGEKLAKMLLRRQIVADFGALNGETVTRKRILWIFLNEAFQAFAARLGGLGHDRKSVS